MAVSKRYYARAIADDLPDDVLPSDFFVIPAADERGHTSRMQFRCNPELDRQGDEIVASKQFPFKTKGDLMRFGYFEACRRLSRYGHHIPDIISELEIVNVMLRRKQRHCAFEDSLQLLQVTIDELQRLNADSEIVDVLNEIGIQVHRMLEVDPYWGERYRQEIERKWGPLRRELEHRLYKSRPALDWGKDLRSRGKDDEE